MLARKRNSILPLALIRALTYYQILGITPDSTLQQIKAAFYRKAQQCHPDSNRGGDSRSSSEETLEWHQLLTSYQVLSNPKTRQLYDLSQRESEHKWVRNAATAGLKGGEAINHEIDLTWGVESWLKQHDKASAAHNNGSLDKMRTELKSDFHAALRHAYFGPDIDELGPDQFPPCFEAEERSHDNTSDLLQIVVGRQLLGRVELRQIKLLSSTERQWLLDADNNSKNCIDTVNTQINASTRAVTEASDNRADNFASSSVLPNDLAARNHKEHQQQEGVYEATQESSPLEEPIVLDLFLGDKITATAIRSSPSDVELDEKHSNCPSGDEELPTSRDGSSSLPPRPPPPLPYKRVSMCINVFDPETGNLLGSIEESSESDTTLSTSSSSLVPSHMKIRSPSGIFTHSVYRSVSPLVRHLTFISNVTTSTKTGKSTKVVARCQRAWLPASSLWLFKPRSYDHDIGGWSIEWLGYESHQHLAWLDPRVMVMVAAFDSWDHEQQGRRPDGVLETAKKRLGLKVSRGSGVVSWLKDVLKFHGKS